MNVAKRGLGRGLDALIPEGAAPRLTEVSVHAIRPNPRQPRGRFSEEGLRELVESIRQSGVLEPVVLRPAGNGYELVAGERRWRAAQLGGLQTVPAVVREVADEQLLQLALVENLQREDLNAMEEAEAFSQLQAAGWSQDAIAQRVGCSRPRITNAIRLLGLPDEAQTLVREGRLQAGTARALLALPEAQRLRVARLAVDGGLSVREIEAMGRRSRRPERTTAAPPEIAAWRERLASTLGVAVQIRARGERGTIEIPYASREELVRILGRIGEWDDRK